MICQLIELIGRLLNLKLNLISLQKELKTSVFISPPKNE
jgi:hypothetical protein